MAEPKQDQREKWTRGPWVFVPCQWNDGGLDGGETPLLSKGSICAVGDPPWFIARIDNAPEEAANAALIAQAPRMYEALESLKHSWGCWCHSYCKIGGKPLHSDECLNVQAVLAAARGEQG